VSPRWPDCAADVETVFRMFTAPPSRHGYRRRTCAPFRKAGFRFSEQNDARSKL
jgi:hypothetical protein